ncbi:transposase, partial [Bradyrhizobium sp. sBnM-33]|uniref:transposase n=1 Tax=Bradyrhizobium sp. sBnM-33 TaxID=2831780 RepID=UPI001BD154EF
TQGRRPPHHGRRGQGVRYRRSCRQSSRHRRDTACDAEPGRHQTGKTRTSAIDERTTRHQGYGMSQSRRAMVECIFGWGKQHGTMRKTKHRGIARVAADFLLNLIAYNLIRIPKLLAA